MRNIIAAFICFSLVSLVSAQNNLPAVTIQDMKGGSFNTGGIQNNGKPIIISFWATWCKPCIAELTAIAENYADWKEETGVKVIAISIDDARNVAKVEPFVNGRSWEYEVYCDPNGDFKRAMSVNTVPHTFLVDGQGNIVWQHNSYNPGDEDELLELTKKLSKGEKINN
jgi:cytochrome c biogenesis protein CcmG/thiol:disulfide interchange protein DsbE